MFVVFTPPLRLKRLIWEGVWHHMLILMIINKIYKTLINKKMLTLNGTMVTNIYEQQKETTLWGRESSLRHKQKLTSGNLQQLRKKYSLDKSKLDYCDALDKCRDMLQYILPKQKSSNSTIVTRRFKEVMTCKHYKKSL